MITEISIHPSTENGYQNIYWLFNGIENEILHLHHEQANKVMHKLIDAQIGYAKPIQVQKEIKYIKAKR